MEKNVSFRNSEGLRLVGVFHSPGKTKHPAVVICHGNRSNKSSKSQKTLAENLGRLGFCSLRFDFSGHGDSEGNYEEMTITRLVDDLRAALDLIEKQPGVDKENIGIIGSSLSGVVSIITAARDARVKALVLRSPVCDIKARFSEEAREWEKKKWMVRKDHLGRKFRMGYGFYLDGIKYDGYKEASKLKIPVLVIHGDKDDVVPLGQSIMLKKSLKRGRLEIIKDCNHNYSRPEHFEKMINLSVDFLRRWKDEEDLP